MKTLYFYKKYKGKENKTLYKQITGLTEHECWKKLMAEEGIRNLTFAKTKFVSYNNPKTSSKQPENAKILVNLKAFTEMYLGTYEAEALPDGYSITLKSGKEMRFDSTGLQKDLPVEKQRFANRIEWA